jgi:hypothetical protein
MLAGTEGQRYKAAWLASWLPQGQSCLSLTASLHIPVVQKQLLGHPRSQIPNDRRQRSASILGKLPLVRSGVEFANSDDYSVDPRCGSCIIG